MRDVINGLLMREGAGRNLRLTEQERSRILALVKQLPAFEVGAGCGNAGGSRVRQRLLGIDGFCGHLSHLLFNEAFDFTDGKRYQDTECT